MPDTENAQVALPQSSLAKACGLYIHIPFCEQKCFYCSFVVAIGQTQRMDVYIDCLIEEMRHYAGRKIQTVYVGGGTPSFLTEKQLEKLFSGISAHFEVEPNSEITLEANPKDLDSPKAKFLRGLGVSRLSIGVQSMNDRFLKYLGRNHCARDVRDTFDVVRRAGFTNVNLDLMYGFPNQKEEDIKSDVKAIVELKAEHVSLYALTIEEHSRFFAQQVKLQTGEIQADHFLLVVELLEEAGYKQYEVSNFAKEGFESKHNSQYWRAEEYIGLGVGAHSYLKARRFWNVSNFQEYLKRVQDKTSAQEGERQMSVADQFLDAFLFGLRMNEGIDIKNLENKFGYKLDQRRRDLIKDFIDHHWLERYEDQLKTTSQGRLVLDELCVRLV